jgi:hypothetical protein
VQDNPEAQSPSDEQALPEALPELELQASGDARAAMMVMASALDDMNRSTRSVMR